MKTYSSEKLKDDNPALYNEVMEAVRLNLPNIETAVRDILIKESYQAAVYSTFVRMVDETTNETLHIEIRTSHFLGLFSMIYTKLENVTQYETFAAYEAARLAMIAKYPATQHGGIRLK